jgi:hypothetical protein
MVIRIKDTSGSRERQHLYNKAQKRKYKKAGMQLPIAEDVIKSKSALNPPAPCQHPLAESIYCMSISQRSIRSNLHYVTGATAIYIGDDMWLAPARCFRFADEILNIMVGNPL